VVIGIFGLYTVYLEKHNMVRTCRNGKRAVNFYLMIGEKHGKMNILIQEQFNCVKLVLFIIQIENVVVVFLLDLHCKIGTALKW
jgi:hypothetical protein